MKDLIIDAFAGGGGAHGSNDEDFGKIQKGITNPR